ILKKHDIRLHILGSDFSGTKEIENKMKEDLKDVKSKVRFYKWKNRKNFNKTLRKMDLLILPSHHETFPFVILEAMAAGIPVICSKIQNLNELFINSNLAYPVLPKNAKSIESSVDFCINNVNKTNTTAQKAQEKIREDYLWDNIIEDYKKLYNSFSLDDTKPTVSTIIPAHNRINNLKKCINSILNQKDFDGYEIIVVDDGSDANPLPELERKYSKYIRSGKIRLYRKTNGGTASARNLGLKKARGDYITFLDDDDLALPNRLRDLTRFLEKNPKKDFVHAKAITTNIRGKRINNSTVCKYFEKFWTSGNLNENTAKILQSNKNCIHSQTVMFRRKIYDLLKDRNGRLFDERLKFGEDFALWKRISKKFNIGFLDKYVSKYAWHPKNKTHKKNSLNF
ncbi:glycosyltransferase, partial [Candidatus Woesearchaeota archaeon]|nr:glycosyltransferase [Candidatus Woesearchaeota archaeon]